MKHKMLLVTPLLFCLAIMVLVVGQRIQEVRNMAIETSGSSAGGVSFPAASAYNDLTVKTISFWIKFNDTTQSNYNDLVVKQTNDGSHGWWLSKASPATSLMYFQDFSGTAGRWVFISWSPTAGAWYHIVLTYDGSSTANAPSAYINNVLKTTVEVTAPSGTIAADTSYPLLVNATGGSGAFSPQMQDVRIYNRILSAQEIDILYNSRMLPVVLGGLVYWAPCNSAAGVSTFDGASLSAANTLRDVVNGVSGVPFGTVTGRGNTTQSFGGQ